MSTVKKGNLFETKCLEIINRMVEEQLFGILKDYVKIYKKKKYPSIYRDNVEFDLTIEIWPPGAERYSMIYFIECKHYGKRIPVEQIQKFHSDIQQVSGVNAKGVFISNMSFQKGAFSYAEKVGMMIIQGESSDNFKIILHKKSVSVETRIEILKDTLNQLLIDSGVESLEKIIDKEILECLSPNKSSVGYGIDLLNKENIKEIAENELNKLNENYLINADGLDAKTITNYISQAYDIKFEVITSEDILGTCDIENNTIGINKSVIGTKRHLFILCHEFGHYLLHQKLTIDQRTYDSFSDSEFNFKTGKHSFENTKHWIEWQANYFSISFLLPETSLIAKLWQYQLRRQLPKSKLYFLSLFFPLCTLRFKPVGC